MTRLIGYDTRTTKDRARLKMNGNLHIAVLLASLPQSLYLGLVRPSHLLLSDCVLTLCTNDLKVDDDSVGRLSRSAHSGKPSVACRNLCSSLVALCCSVVQWLGRWTCNQQVAGSTSDRRVTE